MRNLLLYVWGGGRRKIHLVESTMSSKGGGRLEKWPYLADKCRALRNNYKLGPFLTKTPRCLGFLVFHILWCCANCLTQYDLGCTVEKAHRNYVMPWNFSHVCKVDWPSRPV